MVICSDETQDWERPAAELLREIRLEVDSEDDDEEASHPVTVPAVCSVNDCLQYVPKNSHQRRWQNSSTKPPFLNLVYFDRYHGYIEQEQSKERCKDSMKCDQNNVKTKIGVL